MQASRIVITVVGVMFCVLLASTTGGASPAPSPPVLVQQDDEEWVEFASDRDGDGRADDRDGDGKPDLFKAQLKWVALCSIRIGWCAYTANVICLGETAFECVQTHPYRKLQSLR